SDFKGFYRAFVDHAKEVDRLVDGLNSEFGSYAYFEKPNKSSAISGFETICGGDSEGSGHFRRCQNKLAEFDDAMRSYLRGTDVVDHTNTMDRRINNAASVRGSFKPQETQLNNIQVEHVLYNGNEAVAAGAGVAASMAGMFKAKQKQESLGTDPFDDKGQYGGNQSGFNAGEVKKFLWFNYVDGEDKELFDFVKKNPEYRHYSDMQIRELFEEIDDHGCTYVAMANSVFNEYKGKEKEFEKTFGFSMVGENGDLNFNILVLDIYLETRNKVYLDEPEGLKLYTDCKIEYYSYEYLEYWKKYGEDIFEGNSINPSAYRNIKEEWNEQKKNGEKVVEFKERPSWFGSGVPNRLSHYCQEKGINVNFENKGDKMSNDEIQKAIDQGKTVVFSAHDYEMENEDGSYLESSMGGHEMTITGITPDGRYIVSSYGEKQYFDPSGENIDHFGKFYVIDYDRLDK
ncbi:MAG: hypothetical protein IKQ00_10015, partial [Butyrivibrio sp.]|nr:hypothetical protein [Butyrivibrio sp.]